MEKRKHPRVGSGDLIVDISDGNGFYSGYVSNVSRFGLCLEDIPKRLNQDVRRLSIVVTGNRQSFKMSTKARWIEESVAKKSLGLEILNAPWKWTEFIIDREPEQTDPWGEIHL